MKNAILVWKDGTREESDAGGGLQIIYAKRRDDGGCDQVTFHAMRVGSALEYHEGERIDITERMREAERRNRARTFEVFRRGLDLDDESDSFFTRARRRLARWIRP
jgi:hypothetical protein